MLAVILSQVDGDNPIDWLVGFVTGVLMDEAIRCIGRGCSE